jgi:glycosyltransferase involved in cell wall biosynthesis
VHLGTQPLLVHAEGWVAGRLHASALRHWDGGWAIGSRHASALRAAGVPYLVWEATTLRDELEATSGAEARRAGRGSGIMAAVHQATLPLNDRLERAIYRDARLVVTMSAYGRDRIAALHGFDPSRIEILSPPPPPAYLRAVGSLAEPRALRGEAPRLLFVGRVDDPRKNFLLAVVALTRARASGVEATLTVVGPYTEQWRASVASRLDPSVISLRGRISWDALAQEYLQHDALLISSRQEGFGHTVAEAFHAACPVLATRCGGLESMINLSGGGKLLAHTPEALAEAIISLARTPALRREMSARALRFARSELDPVAFGERVGEMTERLLHPQHARVPVNLIAESAVQ